MKYAVIRTDTADAGIRKIILYIAQNFGNTAALEKLDEIAKRILELGDDPYIGTEPRLFEYYSWFVEKFILKKEMPRGPLFFFTSRHLWTKNYIG